MVRAIDFEDVTYVDKKKNIIVLFEKDKYKIVMPIIGEEGKTLGFDERYGDVIPRIIPAWISEDMRYRLRNKLFDAETIKLGRIKTVKDRDLDISKYPIDEPDPKIETIIAWQRDRGNEFTALLLERLLALKKGDKLLAEKLEKRILEYPKLYKPTPTPPLPTEKVEEFIGDGVTTEIKLREKYTSISQVTLDDVILVEGINYLRKIDNQTLVFTKPIPVGSKLVIRYYTT